MTFQEIYADGSNYQMGFTHGRQASKKIAGTIRYYKQKFEELWNCPWQLIKEFSNRYYAVINVSFPQYIKEMQGIADGSRQLFDDILAINCHYEIARKGNTMENSCSVIGIEATRSADGSAYIAENWDYAVSQKNNTIILKLKLLDNTSICMVTEAGIIGRMGFNSYSVGYCGNTLKNDFVGFKQPLHIMKRLILEQHSLSDVKHVINQYGAGSSYNILAGSQAEGFLDFEIDSSQVTELNTTDGLTIHTNHFVSPSLYRDKEYTKYQKEESVLRYASLNNSLSPITKISFSDIHHALIQHDNHPQGVCTHADDYLPEYQQWATISSLIINLHDQVMFLCEGNPCENTYIEVKLP